MTAQFHRLQAKRFLLQCNVVQAQVSTKNGGFAWSSPKVQYLVESAIFLTVLLAVSQVGEVFPHIDSQVQSVLPGAGVAFAVIMWRGYKMWPVAFLTGVLTRLYAAYTSDGTEGLSFGYNLGLAIGVPLGGTASLLVGVWMVRRFVAERLDFGSIRDVLGFLWWGAIVRSVIVATWAVVFLLCYGYLKPEETWIRWLTWFVGSTTGTIVFGAFLLNWLYPIATEEGQASARETAVLFSLLALVTAADYYTPYPLSFLPFPLLVWGGLRLNPRGQATAVLVVLVVALLETAMGKGPFWTESPDPNDSLLFMQIFVICMAGTGLMLGAIASERRRTLRATAELSSFQKAVLDGSNFSIVVCDGAGIIRSINRGAERLLGYSEKELLGQTPEIFHDPGEIAARARELSEQTRFKIEGVEAFLHLQRTGVADEREWTYIRKDGKRFPVFLSVTPLSPVGNSVPGYMGVAVDITSRKEAEEQMRAARVAAEQANRAKSEFVANISHEIRTPINAILGFSELLQRQLRDPGMKKQAQAIVSSGQTLLQLINDILDLSKVEAGRIDIQPGPVNLRQLLAEMREFFALKAEEKGLELQAEFHGQLDDDLLLDEVRLRQILFNLMGNALKFTERGQVVLAALVEEKTPGEVRLQLQVRDTGIGIPPGQLSQIFTPFEQRSGQSTRKYGGTGLGLSISRRLAELMGGILLASSQVGRGSIFHLTFPRVVRVPASKPYSTEFRPIPLLPIPAKNGAAANGIMTPARSPVQLACLRRCAEMAAGPWMEVWKKLQSAPLSDDVESFAQIIATDKDDDMPDYLREYGQKLADQARDFEVEKMAHSLRQFPELAERLQREAGLTVATVPHDAGL